MTDDHPRPDAADPTPNPPGEADHAVAPNRARFAIEAGIGLVISLLLAWVAVAAVSDVPFVYQGL